MSASEYQTILEAIQADTTRAGGHVSNTNASEAAGRLLPAVRVMAEYGLRVGAIPTIENRGTYITYTTKGGKSQTQEIIPGTLPAGRNPFQGYIIITIQKAFSRLTSRLAEAGAIRYPYSCHDLRHYFACQHYSKNRDIVTLKALLGHASLNVTDIYLQSVGAQK
jgi:integrase